MLTPALLVVFALDALPPPLPVPDLAAWTTRVGRELPGGPSVQVQPLADGVAFVGAGRSLRLAERPAGDAPLLAALDADLAPFAAAGVALSEPTALSCSLAGQPTTCQQVTVTLGPGATMTVTAGQQPDADWVAVCLDRRAGAPGACTGILDL